MADNSCAKKKVSLSFNAKSQKVASGLNLRQQSLQKHRGGESKTAQAVTDNVDDLFTKQEPKEIIIPLIKHNKWRQPTTKPPPLEHDENTTTKQNEDNLTKQQQEALDLILNEEQSNNVQAIIPMAPSNNKHFGVFNQMEMNKVPGIDEVCDPKKRLEIDCALRPDAPDNAEYAMMPISEFGAALLKGMGYNESEPIGNQYGDKIKHLKIPNITESKPRPKNLGFGAVLTKKEAEIMIKRKYNPIKQRTETEKKRIAEIQSWTKSEHEPLRKKQKIDKKNNEKLKEKENKKKKKKKKKKRIKWIRNGLRVRCIKKNNGYFRKKGIVHDVIDEYRFILRMDENDKILLTLNEDEVETVVPKKGEFVMILRGTHKKERGCILSKNKYEQMATVQLEDNLSIVQCDYNDICAI